MSDVDILVGCRFILVRVAGVCEREKALFCVGAGFDVDVCAGTSSDDRELLGCDMVAPKGDLFGLARDIPKKMCNFFRVLDCFGVTGREGVCRSEVIGTYCVVDMVVTGRVFALGVPGTTVAFVAVVVEERGREAIRVVGLESDDSGALDGLFDDA